MFARLIGQGTPLLDKTGGPDTAQISSSEQFSIARPDRPRKRFGFMSALVRVAVALAVVGTTGAIAYSWVVNRPEAPQRMNRERSFTVTAMDATKGLHRADITTFGQIVAARTLDLRVQVQGQVIAVSPNFVAGGKVAAGEVLAKIDPFAYDAAILEARAALANAQLSLAEAREAKVLEESNIATARTSLSSAQTDLERAKALLSSGAATQQTVDTRSVTVAERQQALAQREANLFSLEAQILRQEAAIAQAEHQLAVAQRNRNSTEIIAPFDGTVTSTTLTQGAYVSANENIGSLYETAALDVSFMISDRQYGQLAQAGIADRGVSVTWNVAPRPVSAKGSITRTAAQIDPATGGVTLYARLDAEGTAVLRPGTFVSVTVDGIAHENSLVVPEKAVYDDDHFYVIRDGRMAAVPVTILARQGDELIVSADLEDGARIITSRLSQAGEGVAVMVEGEAPQRGPGGPGFPGGPGGLGAPGPGGPGGPSGPGRPGGA